MLWTVEKTKDKIYENEKNKMTSNLGTYLGLKSFCLKDDEDNDDEKFDSSADKQMNDESEDTLSFEEDEQ